MRKHFTFMWCPMSEKDAHWRPEVKTWKTFGGAEKAAQKWAADMKAEGCEVVTTLGEIVNNKFVEHTKRD